MKKIAIDGPVASGKTVVGRLIAQRLGCRFLDTGIMYRAVTWVALSRGVGLEDDEALAGLATSLEMRLVPGEAGDRLLVDGEDVTDFLREPEVDRGVSQVSAVSGVRRALVEQQRAIASEGSIVMLGRDIGTVVLPKADVKVFLTASVEVRARRRYRELQENGSDISYEQVVSDLERRDRIDRERAASPLRPADDATQIDTDNLGVEEIAKRILAAVEGRQ
ncbi:MAG: (d)CMP kinase [Chloroflexi bacterium]|nr:(d)CMP kinase [Chloroflexota bacterium]